MTEEKKTQNKSITSRQFARLIAVQIIYSQNITDWSYFVGTKVDEIIKSYKEGDFNSELDLDEEDIFIDIDKNFLSKLTLGIENNLAEIEEIIDSNLNTGKNIDSLDQIVRSILTSAVFELKFFTEIPQKVIINEYVTLAKLFYSDIETGFVNGILDKINKKIR